MRAGGGGGPVDAGGGAGVVTGPVDGGVRSGVLDDRGGVDCTAGVGLADGPRDLETLELAAGIRARPSSIDGGGPADAAFDEMFGAGDAGACADTGAAGTCAAGGVGAGSGAEGDAGC